MADDISTGQVAGQAGAALNAPEQPQDGQLKRPEHPDADSEVPGFFIDLRPRVITLPPYKDIMGLNVRYPLIPPYAFAHIFWDDKRNELVYQIEESPLDDVERELFKLIKVGLEEMINISFIHASKSNLIIKYLEKNVQSILLELGAKVSRKSYQTIMYYIYRDFVGLNEIEPLMNDYYIEDVECNGVGTPVYIVHRKYQNLRTNLIYTDMKQLIDFVEKLAQKTGRYVSFAKPLLDGSLPDGSLDYNETVVYRENGMIKIGKIGAAIDRMYGASAASMPVPVGNLEVPCFDENMKVNWKPVQYVYRHKLKPDEKLYRLTLETGREVTLTGAHSLFALQSTGVAATKTETVKVGDFVTIPLKLPAAQCIEELNVAEELSKTCYAHKFVLNSVPESVFVEKRREIREFMKSGYKLFRQAFYEHRLKGILPLKLYHLLSAEQLRGCKIHPTSAVGIPTFLKIDSDLMKLLGYYTAEGWLSSSSNAYLMSFSLNKKETDIVNDIKRAAKNCFGLDARVEKEKRNAVKVHINSFALWVLMKDVLNVSMGAHNKRVPGVVFNSPPELQLDYLKSWWKGDYGYSVSRELISDMLYLSLFQNNVASAQFRKKKAVIDNRSVESEVYYIQRLMTKKLKYPYAIPVTPFNPLSETHGRLRNERISRERMKVILNELRYQRFMSFKNLPPKFLKEWTRRSFYSGGELTEKGKRLVDEIGAVKKLIEGDLGFVKVKNIERVKSTSEYVYDFSVKDNENFVGGLGGVCCHNSRVNATYTSDITTHGPTFTIRKFTAEPLTPVHLIGYETASPEVFAYIWLAIEHKFNLLAIGETASGKTTFLNSVLQFVPEEARIVSIEDTRELALVHENWIPAVSRAGFGIPNILGQQYGEITLFDLLKETFRQNPDYVVVGEVRGKETYILFQGMASVPGDQKVLVLNDEHPKMIPIGEMSENVKYKAITIDPKDCKVKILPVAAVMRHPARSELFRIKMKSGREITTTGDHSLFTYFDGGIVPIRADCLALDSKVVVPAVIPCGYADVKSISLLDLPKVRVFAPKVIRRAVGAVGYDKACDVCGVRAISDYYADFSDCLSSSLGVERFKKLVAEAKINYSSDEIKVKFLRKSKSFPAELELSGSLLKLVGYYISEGSLNDSGKNSAICLYNSKKGILDDMRKCIFDVIGEKPKERVTDRGFGAAIELRFSHKVLFEFLKHYCNKGSHNKRIPDFVFGLSKERISKFVSALFTGDGHITKSNIGYSTVSRQLAEDVMQLLLVYGIVARLSWNRSKKLYSVLFYFKQDREEFLRHVAVLGRNIPVLGKSRMMRDSNKLGEIYLDKVKSVEKIKLEVPVPVFDLCVPGTENFIGNGIMLHNSGHPSYSTFHAASVETLVRRLETPPINLPASLVDSLNIVVSAMHVKDQKRNFRRVRAVEEIIQVKQSIGTVESNKLFEWDPIADKIVYHGNSFIFQSISKATGISVSDLETEMMTRAELLRKLHEQGISHYVEFNSIIHEYYKNPEAVLKRFGIVPSGRVIVASLNERSAVANAVGGKAAVPVAVKAGVLAVKRLKQVIKRKR